MATAEELLSKSVVVDKTLIISNDLRTISIPSTVHNLGVETDDEVLVLSFKMPRYITGLDLSNGFYIRINYINAAGEGDVYTIRSPKVSEDSIEFKWLVGPTATRYKGETRFNVSLVKLYSDGTVDRRYNTHPTSLKVLEGLEVDDSVVEDYGDVVTDIIAQWQKEVVSADEYLVNKSEELLEACKEGINSTGTTVLNDISLTVDDAVGKWFDENSLNTEVSQFGFKYSDKAYSVNISKTTSDSVALYLFESDGGYAAVVSGTGEMKDYSYNQDSGTDTRPWKTYVKDINAVYIDSNVTSIGSHFMYAAHKLEKLVFADSSKITRLGKRCFAATHISGEYAFLGLKHRERTVKESSTYVTYNDVLLDSAFAMCPKLIGVTIGISDDIYEEGTEDPYKQLVISSAAFKHCYDLKYFKVSDPTNNTWTTLEKGCFELCPSLELLEINPSHTSPEGHNFLRIPEGCLKVKYHVLKNASATPPDGAEDTGRMQCVSLYDMDESRWILSYDKNGNRTTPVLSSGSKWRSDKDQKGPCYSAYENMREVRDSYAGRSHQLSLPESDYQSHPDYLAIEYYSDIDTPFAVFWGYYPPFEAYDPTNPANRGRSPLFRNPYHGSCYLFSYYHAWNVLHPNHQFDTFDDFVNQKLKPATITIDHEAYVNLKDKWSFRDKLVTTDPADPKLYPSDYFDEGKTVNVIDLPVSLDTYPEYTQTGIPGEATWAVRKTLGWDGVRRTVSPSDLEGKYMLWANIKRDSIESIFNGIPVLVECVASTDGTSTYTKDTTYQGMHQVTAIGYDGDTDKFLIIDSGVPHDPDVFEPVTYWTTFEALLEPSEESAVWIFRNVDPDAVLAPIKDTTTRLEPMISDNYVHIQQVQTDVDTIDQYVRSMYDRDVNGVKDRVLSLEERASDIEADVDTLYDRTDALESSIGDIDSALAGIIALQKEKIGGDEA